MKKNYFVQFVIILAGLFLSLQNLSAQVICQGDQGVYKENQYWALYTTLEQERGYLSTSWKDYEYSYDVYKDDASNRIYSRDCPGETFSYQAKKDNSSTAKARGKAYHADYEKGEKIVIEEHGGRGGNIGTSYGTWYSGSVERKVRKVSVGMNGSVNKSFRYPRVTMASYFEFNGYKEDERYTPKTIYPDAGTFWTAATTAEIVVNFSNIGNNITVQETSDEDGVFSANVSTTTGLAGKWGTITFEVTCNHSQSVGKHTGQYTLTLDDGTLLTINVESETKLATTTINWDQDYVDNVNKTATMTVGDEWVGVASAGNGAEITYSIETGKGHIIKVEDKNKLVAKTAGVVKVTATATMKDLTGYEPATDDITINVLPKSQTNLLDQTLTWDEGMKKFLSEGLTIQAYENNPIYLDVLLSPNPDSPRQSSKIYTIITTNSPNGGDVAKVEGNVLTILKEGTAKLRAEIAADDTYKAAYTDWIDVIIRSTTECTSYIFAPGELVKENPRTTYGAWSSSVTPYDITWTGEPGKISFSVTANMADRILFVYKRINDVWEGYKEGKGATENGKDYGTPWKTETVPNSLIEYDFSKEERNVTGLRFAVKWQPAKDNYAEITNVVVTRARYLEPASDKVDFGQVPVGVTSQMQTLELNYSNLPLSCNISLETSDTRFSIYDGAFLDNACGSGKEYGTHKVMIKFDTKDLGVDVDKTLENNLIITDHVNPEYTCTIPISATVVKAEQTMNWTLAADMYVPTIYEYTLPATTAQGQSIECTSSDASIAYVDNTTKKLVIKQAGEVTITTKARGTVVLKEGVFTNTFHIRTTAVTIPTQCTLSPIMQDDALSLSIIKPDGEVVTNEDKDLYTNHTVAGTWSFVNPPQELNYGTHTLQVQFKADKDNFYTPDPSTPQEATLEVKPYDWLSAMPANGTVVAEKSAYRNFLFAENGDSYAELTTTKDITITEELSYMFFVTAADDWRTFVAPFDISNAYVIEMTPEVDDRYTMEANQPAAYAALYKQLVDVLATKPADKTAKTVVEEFIATQPNRDLLGIYDITSDYYYLYESAETWNIVDGRLEKQWTEINSSSMEKGKTYAIRFPWCELCQDRTPWDYWTGKLILFTGVGPQEISGSHVLESDIRVSPDVNTAMFVGNHSFASMDVPEDVWVYDVATGKYMSQGASKVKPTASFLYANIPARQGKRAVAITRQGEIVWEDDADNSGVVTDIEAVEHVSLRVMSQEDGFSVVSSAAQPIQVYAISGALIYQGTIAAEEAQFFSVEAGVYVVRTATHAYKVIAR